MTTDRASVRYTYDFVRSSLPDGARSIVEVGCGSGELAAMLMSCGLKVIAVDSDAECVAQARRIGVDARLVHWPAAMDAQADAVLFTRSLHHVDDLPGSVVQAARALNSGGRIIVEDFRAEGGSDRSTEWYAGVANLLIKSGALSAGIDLNALLDKAAPSSDHDHHLHSSAAIAEELRQFDGTREADAAYYFRYLEPHLSEEGAEALLNHELAMIELGSIDALGKRFVGTL